MVVGGTRPLVAALSLSLSLLSSCARVAETTSYTQTKISSRTEVEVVLRSLEYSAATRLEGQVLVLSLRREERCRTSVTPTYRKEAHIRRETKNDVRGYSFAPSTTFVFGALLGVSGALSYTGAEQLASEQNDPEKTPESYRTTGVILGAVGAAVMGIALIDVIRLRDEDKVVGDVEGPAEIAQAPCNEGPAKNVELGAVVGSGGVRQRVTTDAAGKARLALHELPEEAFAPKELGLVLEIDDHTLRLSLSAAETSALLARLAADPLTPLAKARAAKEQAACEQAVTAAAAHPVDGETLDAGIERIEAAWAAARQRCGARWAPVHTEAWQKVQAQIAATAKERATRRCAEEAARAEQTLAERLEAEEPSQLEALHAAVAASCEGAPNEARILAALAVKEKAARELERRRAELAANLEKLDACFQEDDAVCIRGLARDRDVVAVLRGAPEARGWIHQIASRWISTLQQGGSGAALRAQLCASRALVQTFLGAQAWANLRAAAVQRSGLVAGAALANELRAARCK